MTFSNPTKTKQEPSVKSFRNKVAAITGAGSGIGQALALNLASQGCHLALSDINESGLQETAESTRAAGVKVTTTILDVSDRQAVFAWAEKTAAEHGSVNMVFNNAGVALSGTVGALSVEDYEWIMNINFWGVLYGTKAFLPLLEQSGEGHVVNISSVFGLTSQPMMSGYNASKFAVRGFTESLRQDLELAKSKVTATCVHPGGIKTNIAKAARVSESVKALTGVSDEETLEKYEKMFIHTPDTAAKTILKGVRKNKRRVLIGMDARMFDWAVRVAPTGYQKVFTKATEWFSKSG